MQDILSQFTLSGGIGAIKAFGNGHIHDSYRVSNTDSEACDYLLQKVNHQVFKDVPGVMNNIQQVTQHINKKVNLEDGQITLKLVDTVNGDSFYKSPDDSYWRVYEFLDGLKSYDLADTNEQVYEGARSYGFFMKYLDDFPAQRLAETIPDFHNVITRLEAFDLVVENPFEKRKSECKDLIEFVHQVADQLTIIQQLKIAGKIKTRITHNDTKFNNVLLTQDDKGKCVVDLDTVMPGVVHFDFGDGIRTGACTASEEEPDLQLVGLDLERFEAFAQGYLEVTHDYLSTIELDYMALSGALLPYIMGVRFLTDYLSGDTYYKIKYKDHNLVRARNQMHLSNEILKLQPDLRSILKKI